MGGGMVTISEQCPYVFTSPPHGESEQKGEDKGRPYCDFKINKLLGKCAHIVIKAESVLARLFRGEDEVALSLLLRTHDDLVSRTDDAVVDIERASRLNLLKSMHQTLYFVDCSVWWRGQGRRGNLRQSRRPILHPFPPHSWRSKLSHWDWAYRWGPWQKLEVEGRPQGRKALRLNALFRRDSWLSWTCSRRSLPNFTIEIPESGMLVSWRYLTRADRSATASSTFQNSFYDSMYDYLYAEWICHFNLPTVHRYRVHGSHHPSSSLEGWIHGSIKQSSAPAELRIIVRNRRRIGAAVGSRRMLW